MESYVIRVYRREDDGKIIGRLISASSGEEMLFHSREELMQKLGMNGLSTTSVLENGDINNSNN